MTMITPSYLGETIEYSSLHACRSTLEDPTFGPNSVGLFAKFAAPTIANGKVFVATYGDHENPQGPINYLQQNTPPAGSVPRNYYVAVYGLK